MASTFEDVIIRVTQRGADEAAKSIGLIGKESEKTTGAVAALNRIMYTLGAALSVKSLVDTVTAYESMANQLKLVTKNATELAATQDRLFKMANQNRTSVEDLTDLYTKLSLAQKETGVSGERIYKVVDLISKSLTNNGKGSQAAAAGLKQLIQGLQSGLLRGEELNSVLENTPYLAKKLAEGLNVPIGQLRKMGSEGQLTAQRVIQAFEKMGPSIIADFNKMNITISQALTVLDNSWKQFIGGASDATGASKVASTAIILLANNLGTVVTAIGLATAAWIAYRIAVTAVAAAQTLANIAINANPIVRVVTIILTAVAALIALTGNTENAVKWITNLGTSAYETFQSIVKGTAAAVDWFGSLITSVTTTSEAISTSFTAAVQSVWDFIKSWYEWLADLIGTQLPKTFKDAVDSVYKFFEDGFTRVKNFIIGIFDSIKDALNSFVNWASGVISSIVSAAQRALATIKSLGSGSSSSEVSGARASGGPVSGGKTYLVGENGPELFSPSVNGMIIPNGGNGTVINNSSSGTGPVDGARRLQQILDDTLGTRLQAIQDISSEQVSKLDDLIEIATKISNSTAATNSTVQASAAAAAASGSATSAINNYVQNGMTTAAAVSTGSQPVAEYGGGTAASSSSSSGNATYADYASIKRYATELVSLMKRYEQNIATDPQMNFSRTRNSYAAQENYKNNVIPASIRDQVIQFANGMMPARMSATIDLSGAHGLTGFRSGGSFTVPGGTGVDSKVVAIRATPGEEISIKTPSQQRQDESRSSQGGNTIIVQIQTPDADSFNRSQKQVLREFAVNISKALG